MNAKGKQCGICEKYYTTDKILKKHVQMQHGPTKSRYKCPQCDGTFTTPYNLIIYAKSHGLELLKKDVVESNEPIINEPKKITQKRVRDKMTCDVCGKVCTGLSNFYRHKRNKHAYHGKT